MQLNRVRPTLEVHVILGCEQRVDDPQPAGSAFSRTLEVFGRLRKLLHDFLTFSVKVRVRMAELEPGSALHLSHASSWLGQLEPGSELHLSLLTWSNLSQAHHCVCLS